MKSKLLENIKKSGSNIKSVYNEKGERISISKLEDGVFYCYSKNSLASDKSKESFMNAIGVKELGADAKAKQLLIDAELEAIEIDIAFEADKLAKLEQAKLLKAKVEAEKAKAITAKAKAKVAKVAKVEK